MDYTHFFLDGRVEVTEYEAPYDQCLLYKIQCWCEASKRSGYEQNYEERPGDNSSLMHLINTAQLPRFYICWVDGEFAFFSGVRPIDDDYLMLGVRCLSNKRRKDRLPYHAAYVIPLQIEYAKKMGYRYVFTSYNVGVRTGLYKSIMRLRDKVLATDVVTQTAQAVTRLFEPLPPRNVNNVYQHVLQLKVNP